MRQAGLDFGKLEAWVPKQARRAHACQALFRPLMHRAAVLRPPVDFFAGSAAPGASSPALTASTQPMPLLLLQVVAEGDSVFTTSETTIASANTGEALPALP